MGYWQGDSGYANMCVCVCFRWIGGMLMSALKCLFKQAANRRYGRLRYLQHTCLLKSSLVDLPDKNCDAQAQHGLDDCVFQSGKGCLVQGENSSF